VRPSPSLNTLTKRHQTRIVVVTITHVTATGGRVNQLLDVSVAVTRRVCCIIVTVWPRKVEYNGKDNPSFKLGTTGFRVYHIARHA